MTTDAREPTYDVNIEGIVHIWHAATITPAQIRELASFDDTQQIIEVNLEDNSERTLPEGDGVRMQPGKAFAKRVRFQRG